MVLPEKFLGNVEIDLLPLWQIANNCLRHPARRQSDHRDAQRSGGGDTLEKYVVSALVQPDSLGENIGPFLKSFILEEDSIAVYTKFKGPLALDLQQVISGLDSIKFTGTEEDSARIEVVGNGES